MLLLLSVLAALAASPSSDEVLVNRFASVQSADGYLNLRPTPSTAREPTRQLDNGTPVLVITCASQRKGRRWCRVRAGSVFEGYVYDAELEYEPLEPATDEPGGLIEGTGALPGFRGVEGRARVRSADGYLNLRAGPSTSRRVLSRIPNGAVVPVYACQRRARGARWCLVDFGELLNGFGYVYDRELVYGE
ncbi:MAG: SH3 domain-containing protein [Bacteroidota bacterium]